jgi:hypothetical protein
MGISPIASEGLSNYIGVVSHMIQKICVITSPIFSGGLAFKQEGSSQ